ncbi:hypothetical protein RZS08_61460, partial [Arthrospira platensis SPKY1]|nr:hypothetical protein [Arthrospira platensis SPKY1]
MVVLAGKISILGLLLLIPSALIGWLLFALTMHFLYLRPLNGQDKLNDAAGSRMQLKPGGASLTAVAFLSIVMAVLANIFLHVSIDFAVGVA